MTNDKHKINYNRKTRTFSVIWKDYEKEALQDKYPYSRKSKKWNGDKAPNAAERRIIESELKEHAAKKQQESKAKADLIKKHGKDEALYAVGYLLSLKDDELCKSQNEVERKKAKRHIAEFVDFLNANYKNILLHEVTVKVAKDYYKHLEKQGFLYSTIKEKIARLSFLFKWVTIKYQESPLNFNNPFSLLPLSDVIDKVAPMRKERFTTGQLHSIFGELSKSNRLSREELLQRYAFFYFLTVTGWRVADVARLQWKQVLNNKIHITHSKTKKKKLTTEIAITPLMAAILHALKGLQAKAPKEWQGFFFPLRRESNRNFNRATVSSAQVFLKINREKLGLTQSQETNFGTYHAYTIHSFRGTTITQLTKADFQDAKINFLVGHAPRTIEERHYLSLTASDTKKLILHMEECSGAALWADEVELIKEAKADIERLRIKQDEERNGEAWQKEAERELKKAYGIEL